MRVSTSQVFNVGLESMQKHSVEVMKYQTQISSGNKYQRASDSGLAAGLGVQVQLDQSQFSMFKVNQNHIAATYASTESQISAINKMLIRAQQLMVQAGNDSVGPDGRRLIAQELSSLKDAIDQAAGAKDANGQPILKSSIHKIIVAPQVDLDSGVLLSDVMTTGVNISTLMGSVVTQLSGPTPAAPTTAHFNDMSAAITQVTQAQVRVGVFQNRLDAAVEMADTQKTNVELERSNLLDTDLAEASAGLMKSNALLQAAQSVMAKMDTNSLFQKL